MTEPTSRREAPLAAILAAISGVLVLAALWRRQPAIRPAVTSPTPSRPDGASENAGPAAIGNPVALPPLAPAWQEPTKYIMGVLLLLIGVAVVFIGRGAISLIILAALLALFLQPAVRFLMTRLRFPRGLAVATPYLLVVIALVIGLVIVIPSALEAFSQLATLDYARLLTRLTERITELRATLAQRPLLANTVVPALDELLQTLSQASEGGVTIPAPEVVVSTWLSGLASALGALTRLATPVVGAIVSIFLVLLMSLQMMVGVDSIRAWHPGLVPARYRLEVDALKTGITAMWVSFIRGQVTLMILIGALSTAGYLALGVPQAVLLGILAGLLELIPSLGPTLAAIPAVALSLLLGSSVWNIGNLPFALIVTGFCVLLQLAENQVIVPKLMGDAVKLPPLIVLIGVIVGASAFGILGAFLSTPIIATFDQVFRFVYRKIQEQPAVEIEPPPPTLMERLGQLARQIRRQPDRG